MLYVFFCWGAQKSAIFGRDVGKATFNYVVADISYSNNVKDLHRDAVGPELVRGGLRSACGGVRSVAGRRARLHGL